MFQFLTMMLADQPSVTAGRRSALRHLPSRQLSLRHSITIWSLAAIAALVAVMIAALPVHAEPSERPNIVLIMADDMGYECVSCNGGDTYQTPRLDELAKGGIRFLHCHSQPICTPSRVQIMTGLYNNRNYIRFGLLDPRATTFAQLLKRAGYATCVAGKWQLEGGIDAPQHFGFDEYCLWQLTRRPGRYVNPGLEINGKLSDFSDGQFGPDIVSDYLCDFIERHKDQPFFAYYPMILPHWPFEPTPDSADYDKTANSRSGHGDEKYFADMIAYTDKIVGKIADKLDSLGIRKNTVVIFTGDNGTYTGITSSLNGRPYRGGKGNTQDNGTHVPMIASWPGTSPAGHVTDALVDFSDLLPTLTELAGAKVSSDLNATGVSFAPLLRGEPFDGRDWVYCWYERNGRRGSESQHTRDRQFKLYADGRFFDVLADFEEKRPLDIDSLDPAGRASYQKLKRELERELAITAEATAAMKKRDAAAKKTKATNGPSPARQ